MIHKTYILLAFLVVACATPEKKTETAVEAIDTMEVESTTILYDNPPAEGFNQEGSDLLATLIADKVMLAMGGRQAWDATRFLSWNFFGSRLHYWDKHTGAVRIEDLKSDLQVLMNIHTKEGMVQKNGEQLSGDSLSYYLDRGYGWWVNDSYWLIMPYKLKDTGVTLKYMGTDTAKSADQLQMTFEEVGVTPENIYHVWVDIDSKLVTSWAYYKDSTVLEPRFDLPWTDYQQYGSILLSSKRGQYELTDIQVLDSLDGSFFTSF